MKKALAEFVKRITPAPVFHLIRDLPYIVGDTGPGRPVNYPIPRLRDQFDDPRGYDVFIQNGLETFNFYKDVVGIQPDWKMLDIGCGIGRKTLPLLNFFNEDSLYVGVDIDDRGVKWCSKNISPINNRFVFFKINVFNKFYNPAGSVMPDRLVFPFSDNSFDLVSLWSVFTHMYTKDISRYLEEISRMLKPGGTVSASYYIINDHAKAVIANGKAGENIVHRLPDDDSWTNNPNIPEDLIAVDEQWLRTTYAKFGLKIREPIMFGNWADNPTSPAYQNLNRQDIVVAEKM